MTLVFLAQMQCLIVTMTMESSGCFKSNHLERCINVDEAILAFQDFTDPTWVISAFSQDSGHKRWMVLKLITNREAFPTAPQYTWQFLCDQKDLEFLNAQFYFYIFPQVLNVVVLNKEFCYQ